MHSPPYFLLPIIVALGGTLLILFALLRSGMAQNLALDKPNERSLHMHPTPRVGGIAMLSGILLAWLLLPSADQLLIGLVFILAMISFLDDRKGLPISLRLALHTLVALVFILFHTSVTDPWLVALFTMAIVWLINLFNFMDGADGLAGGMALFGFGAYGTAAFLGGDFLFAIKCFCVAGAAVGFLAFNFPPARVFMGDAGAIPLGFLAGVMGLEGWDLRTNLHLWHFWFPVLVFSPFVVDASVTLLKRIFCGERFWMAHQQHYYQRLIRMGASHRQVVLGEYGLMACSGLSAFLSGNLPAEGQYFVLGMWCIVYVVLMTKIDNRWRNFEKMAGTAK